jgi:hypothetical protein
VHESRVTQVRRLGDPYALVEVVADYADWHDAGRLARRGCSPQFAVRIVR